MVGLVGPSSGMGIAGAGKEMIISFSPARSRGLDEPFHCPDEAFMVLELWPGALEGVAGMVTYPPAFSRLESS